MTDPTALADFVRVSTAYRVLTGPLREEYDRARRGGQTADPPIARPEPRAAAPRWRLSARGARAALWGGIVLVVLGLAAAGAVIALQVRDAQLRGDGVVVDAAVVQQGGEPRLLFTTRRGEEVVTDVPDPKSGGWRIGESVEIRYDPEDPQRVVTEHRTLARDITLWIVAVKLLVVGTILAVIGRWQLRHRELVVVDDADG